ncbi:MAG TPA: FtsX-like permease family protein [Cyclobacteriaceae bacterium]|nr:FtsX-like permease family protein [Cyclobacteriaceae bacterium]
MLKKILSSFLLAFHNIRSHFFHTLLSVLGIVIGVAALVSILSLIDGMEDFAKKQITETTSLNSITINPNAYKKVNGVRIRKDTFAILKYDDYSELKSVLTKPCSLNYMSSFAGTTKTDGAEVGTLFFGLGSPALHHYIKVTVGEPLTADDIISSAKEAMVNEGFVKAMDSTLTFAKAIGRRVIVKNRELTIVAVISDNSNDPHLAFPLTLMTAQELRDSPPSITIEATVITDVADLKSQVHEWINKKYKDGSDFVVFTNEMRVEQATKGFLLFRIVMGLIVGISVVVGGIGIMNVLLISITERTVEIGIRKAVGANRRDIILQFLAESVTVSVFGSVIGLIFGVLGTMAVVPIISSVSRIPFYANYTADTLIVVSVLAVVLGIIFGTYPAIRASRLDPVEAIRHE